MTDETRQRAKKRAKTRKELARLHREADERAFDTFLNAADLARTVEQVIEDRRPASPDEEWNEAFCKALGMRERVMELCDEAEVRMMIG